MLAQRERRSAALRRIRRAATRPKGAHWIRPDLVAEVAFTEWSDDGALRHPSFQGLRADKQSARRRPGEAHDHAQRIEVRTAQA